ncbi:hypothetical protein ACFQ9X_12055 [Catenulispora yoronensis]
MQIIAELLTILPEPIYIARKATLPDAVRTLRDTGDLLSDRITADDKAQYLTWHSVENWVTAAMLLTQGRSLYGPQMGLRSALYHTDLAYDFARQAVVELGADWPPKRFTGQR